MKAYSFENLMDIGKLSDGEIFVIRNQLNIHPVTVGVDGKFPDGILVKTTKFAITMTTVKGIGVPVSGPRVTVTHILHELDVFFVRLGITNMVVETTETAPIDHFFRIPEFEETLHLFVIFVELLDQAGSFVREHRNTAHYENRMVTFPDRALDEMFWFGEMVVLEIVEFLLRVCDEIVDFVVLAAVSARHRISPEWV